VGNMLLHYDSMQIESLTETQTMILTSVICALLQGWSTSPSAGART